MNKLISTIRAAEAGSTSAKIIDEYRKNDWSADRHLTGIFTVLAPVTDELTTAVKRIKAESDLELKDEIRDNRVRALYYAVTGYVYNPDGTISAAAVRVQSVLDHYGISITAENYATESLSVDSLLKDLADPGLMDAVAALPGFSALVTQLTSANNEFKAADLEFRKEKAEEGTFKNATELKKEIIAVINDKLVVYLRAMIQVDEAKYGGFIRTVEQIIDDMNVIIRKRFNGNDNDNDTPGA